MEQTDFATYVQNCVKNVIFDWSIWTPNYGVGVELVFTGNHLFSDSIGATSVSKEAPATQLSNEYKLVWCDGTKSVENQSISVRRRFPDQRVFWTKNDQTGDSDIF